MSMPFVPDAAGSDRWVLAATSVNVRTADEPSIQMTCAIRLTARRMPEGVCADFRAEMDLSQPGAETRRIVQSAAGRDAMEQLCQACALAYNYLSMIAAMGHVTRPTGEPFEIDHGIFSMAEVWQHEQSVQGPPNPLWLR